MTQAPHMTLASDTIWIYMVLSVSILFHFLLLFLLPMSSSVTALLAQDGFTGSLEFFLLCGTQSLRLSIILTLNICFSFIFIRYLIVYPQQTFKKLIIDTYHFYSLCLFLHFLSSCLPLLLTSFSFAVLYVFNSVTSPQIIMNASILYPVIYAIYVFSILMIYGLLLLEIKLHEDRNLCLVLLIFLEYFP